MFLELMFLTLGEKISLKKFVYMRILTWVLSGFQKKLTWQFPEIFSESAKCVRFNFCKNHADFSKLKLGQCFKDECQGSEASLPMCECQ